MTEATCCGGSNVLIFPCAGGSNVGWLTYQAAIDLSSRGMGKVYCLAGIGGHVEGMVNSARSGFQTIVLDGCPTACARMTLEHAEVPIDNYFVLTEMGVKKEGKFSVEETMQKRVCEQIFTAVGGK